MNYKDVRVSYAGSVVKKKREKVRGCTINLQGEKDLTFLVKE